MINIHDIQHDKKIKSLGGKFTYVFKVSAYYPQRIFIKISNANKPDTVYINRFKDIEGSSTFYCRMPQSTKEIKVEIYDKAKRDDTFVVKSSIIPLSQNFTSFDSSNSKIHSFMKFAQWFAENSAILSNGKYQSNNGQFMIEMLDTLKDNKGRPVTTPSRIGVQSGIIQVNRKQFNDLTVFGRVAILLHEFSHFYLNKDINNEYEADWNATNIYLGYGYPRIEALRNYIKTFQGNPTDENVGRYMTLERHIKDFDKLKFTV